MASFLRISIEAFLLPPLEGAGTIKKYSSLNLYELYTTPLDEVCVIYEKSKFGLR
jgi:hypothetical protein